MAFKPISRRSFLQAGSAIIGLPLLEAMLPFKNQAWGAGSPLRYACLYFPHGTTEPGDWDPTLVNGQLRLNPSGMLNSLQPHINDITFFKNIYVNSWSLHPGAVTSFMTAGNPPAANIVTTKRTIDQLIADGIATSGQIHSLIMSSDDSSGGEAQVSGIYGSNISWTSATVPATRRFKNSQIFDMLFPGGAATTTPGATLAQSRKSILDFAKASIVRTQAQLGAVDKQTLDQYLTSLREVEKRIQTTTPGMPLGPPVLTPAMVSCSNLTSLGTCVDYQIDMDLKMDMIALAFQADRTRVATMLFDPEPGYRDMSFLSGVRGQNHTLSHWRDNPTNGRAMMRTVTSFYVSKFARLVERLKSINEVGGTVLDNSLILFGGGAIDSHNHDSDSIPLIMAGKAGGGVVQGTQRVFPYRTNIGNLHMTIAQKMGVPLKSYADSSTVLNLT